MFYHIHNETWNQTRRRYEREAIALEKIMPEVHLKFFDMFRYILISVFSDLKAALSEGLFLKKFFGIVKFRIAQYSGSFKGNHDHRKISNKRKENYFYPNKRLKD